jgi:hypothetical protein
VTDISTLRHSELVSPQCPLGGFNPRAAMLRDLRAIPRRCRPLIGMSEPDSGMSGCSE